MVDHGPSHEALGASKVEPFVGGLEIHTFEYPNGLVLKVVPDHQAPVVAFQTWFRVGSSDEVEGKTGLAHLFEHMMFKGTERYTEGEFQAKVDAMGGSRHLNAWTWLDQTVYVGAVPSGALDAYAELEASRMTGLVVDEAAFRSELEVVTNERRLVVDNDPNGLLDEQLMAEAYRVHAYGWPTIGWQRDLDKLTADDARSFYKRWYAPDNATIVIVGDVEPVSAAAIVARHYAQLPPARPQRAAPPVEPEQTEARRFEKTLPLATERLLVVLKAPEYTHPDVPALLVLNAALTSSSSSRLVRALRDTGLVADVSSSIAPLRYPTVLQFTLTGRPDVPIDVAEAALWRELERVSAGGISPGELAMGVAQWETANQSGLADASGKASFLGWAMTHTGSVQDGLERIRAISRVTADDVKRVAKTWLRRERSTTAVGRPPEDQRPKEPVELPDLAEPAERTEFHARALAAPAGRPSDRVEETAIGRATLLTAYDPALPVVQLQLRLAAGGAEDPPGKEGTAYLAGELLMRGTRSRSRARFEEALDQLGASLGVSVAPESTSIGGRVLDKNWPAVTELLREALAEPAFDADELEQLKEEVIAEIAASLDSDDNLAELAIARALYGPTHPHGRDVRGTPDSIARVTRDDLVAWYARAARSDRALVGVSGRFDAEYRREVDAILGALSAEPVTPTRIAAPPTFLAGKVLLVDKPERNQAQLRLALAGLDPQRADFPAFVLFNDGFGVGFGGRLMKEVRVKRGWSYFAYSMPLLHPGFGEWQVTLAPGNEYAVEALALVRDLAAEALREGLLPEEIEQARATRLHGLPFEIDTAAKRLDHAIRARTLGYDRVAATHAMERMTVDEVNRSFADYVSVDRLAIAVVGSASALLPALREKFGEVVVLPYDALGKAEAAR